MASTNLSSGYLKCEHCLTPVFRGNRTRKRRSENNPLAGKVFCNRDCQKRHFRREFSCCWPGCRERTIRVTARNGRVKRSTSYLCDDHAAALARLGDAGRITSARKAFLSDEVSPVRKSTNDKFVRMSVFLRADGQCCKCEVNLPFAPKNNVFDIDHVIPCWMGGETRFSNLQLLCKSCHIQKSSKEQQSLNARRRYAPDAESGPLFCHSRAMTHCEKDQLINKLREEVSRLLTRYENNSRK